MGGCSFSIHNIAYRLQGFKSLMLKTYVALLHCRLEIVLEVVRLQCSSGNPPVASSRCMASAIY